MKCIKNRYHIRLTAKNRCIGIGRKWRTRSNTNYISVAKLILVVRHVVMALLMYLYEIVAAIGAETCRAEEGETWFVFGAKKGATPGE